MTNALQAGTNGAVQQFVNIDVQQFVNIDQITSSSKRAGDARAASDRRVTPALRHVYSPPAETELVSSRDGTGLPIWTKAHVGFANLCLRQKS